VSRIEEGCMALVISGAVEENIGKIVAVGKFLGTVKGFSGNDNRWEVSPDMMTSFGTPCNHNQEPYLMRIDDTDTENQTAHKIEEEIAR